MLQEFFEQGDKERAQGMPVSPMMDRETTSPPLSQINFIEFIVAPLFAEVWSCEDRGRCALLPQPVPPQAFSMVLAIMMTEATCGAAAGSVAAAECNSSLMHVQESQQGWVTNNLVGGRAHRGLLAKHGPD